MLINQDSLQYLKTLPDNSIDLGLTDPPYFLDKLDNEWKPEDLEFCTTKQNVKSLPGGMKFDKEQGKKFYKWYHSVSIEMYRILKPGAFFFSFSSPRLYHRMTCAIEDGGFLIKDCFVWLYTKKTQPKAMSLKHFLVKMKMPEKEKSEWIVKIAEWKTPQVKSCFEPIAVAQKEPEGTLLQNFMKYGVGLFNTCIKIGDNCFPANCFSDEHIDDDIDKFFLVQKPGKAEKGDFNNHKTVKPISICRHLIALSTQPGATIIDPFVGSGTTCVAAQEMGRKYVGIDINAEYLKIAEKRLK